MKKRLLLPTNDYVFKRIFGKKGNEDITTEFIEAVTGVRYEEINLEDTPILERDLLEKKIGVLDVKVIANKENDIDLEMQVVKSEYIADRILWYWAKMYSASIDRGESYNNTKRAICILIADFCLEDLKAVTKYHTKWHIREDDFVNIILTEKLEIHIIELEKLENMKILSEEDKKLLNWCKFIKNPDNMEDSTMSENNGIKRAKEELDKISQDAKERRLAELREKALMDEIAIRDSGFKEGYEEGKASGIKAGMKEGMQEGMKQGMQEGMKQGIQEGMKQGIQEGMKQGIVKKQIEIAKKMIKENINISIISKITDLSEEQIKELY